MRKYNHPNLYRWSWIAEVECLTGVAGAIEY